MGFTSFLGRGNDPAGSGWNESERQTLQATIAARQAFIDFPFSRVDASGQRRHFLISGEPMFNAEGGYTGYRGIGVEASPDGQARRPGNGERPQPQVVNQASLAVHAIRDA